MSQMTENGALLGQVDRLHTEVRKVAEAMAVLHNTKKVIDQKTTVIGKALINQKDGIQSVSEQIDNMRHHVDECCGYAEERREALRASVTDVTTSIQGLRNLEGREDTLLKSLERLGKNQSIFMKSSLAMAKKADMDLTAIKKIVEEIKKLSMDLQAKDPKAFMEGKVLELETALYAYVDLRTKITTQMAEQVVETENRILAIQEVMESQKEQVAAIAQISKRCEEQTVQMCQKLEQLLTLKGTDRNMSEMSLEDMFTEETVPDEGPFEDLDACLDDEAPDAFADTEDDNSDTSDIGSEMQGLLDTADREPMEESMEEDAEGFEEEAFTEQELEDLDELDEDFQIVGDYDISAKKKKRLFGGLFGGDR